MPDFLPKPSPQRPSGGTPPTPSGGFRLFGRGTPGAVPPPPGSPPAAASSAPSEPPGPDTGADNGISVVRKGPSKFWTEYYGVAFIMLVGVFFTTGLLILKPLLVDYRQIGGEIATAGAVLTDERSYLESLQRSIDAAQKIPPETLADVEEALPRGVDIPKLLTMLSRLAVQHQIDLNSVQFSVGGDAGEVQEVDISMDIGAADYFVLRAYLRAVEQNLQILDLQSISVVPTQAESNSQTYPVTLRTYALPGAATRSP